MARYIPRKGEAFPAIGMLGVVRSIVRGHSRDYLPRGMPRPYTRVTVWPNDS